MHVGLVGRTLLAADTPESSRLQAQFEAAHSLGVRHLELWVPDWDHPGTVDHVGELQERYAISVHLGFIDDYIGHAEKQPTEKFAELVERVCRPLGVHVIRMLATPRGTLATGTALGRATRPTDFCIEPFGSGRRKKQRGVGS